MKLMLKLMGKTRRFQRIVLPKSVPQALKRD
jgi:hypothetical protein